MSEYTEGHKDLAQFLFVYCAVEEKVLQNVYDSYMKVKCNNDSLDEAINKIEKKLEDLNFGIAKKFKYKGDKFYALYPESTLTTITVNKEYQEKTSILTDILEIIYESWKSDYSWNMTVNDIKATLAEKREKLREDLVQGYIDEFVISLWLYQQDENITVGIRSILNFPDLFDNCEACQKTVAGETYCPNCGCFYHFQCKMRACIKCSKQFEDNNSQ